MTSAGRPWLRPLALPLLVAAVLLVLLSALAVAAPQLPALTGRVVDQAGMLDRDREAALTAKLAALEEKSTDQLVVVTLDSLQGYEIEEFGVVLGRSWQIGQKGKNNGVLLIVAPNERKVRIEVGYGLEGTLTDTLAGDIVRNRILPLFRTGQMAEGIDTGVDDIVATLTGNAAEVEERAKGARRDDGGLDPVALLILGFWALMFFGSIGQGLFRSAGSDRGGVIVVPYIPPPSGNWSGGSYGGGSGGGWSSGGGGFSGGGGSFGGGGSSGSW